MDAISTHLFKNFDGRVIPITLQNYAVHGGMGGMYTEMNVGVPLAAACGVHLAPG